MAIVRVPNKQRGIVYAYESTSYWDKEKKQPRSRRKCIGHFDPATGGIVPNRPRKGNAERPAAIREFGCDLLFSKVVKGCGLDAVLRKAFPDRHHAILTCAYCLLSEGQALSRCEQWSAGSVQPYGGRLADQRISELLASLDREAQMDFFRRWVPKQAEKEYFALDITSISSYSALIASARPGYNRDGEDLRIVNLSLLVGTGSRLPAYFDAFPGSIRDVSTLKRFIGTVGWMGFRRLRVVMDKGFCSSANISGLYAAGMKFTLGMSFALKFTRDAVEEVRGTIGEFGHRRRVLGCDVHVATSLKKWEGHRCYTHVYFDGRRAADDREHFMERLEACRDALMSGNVSAEDGDLGAKYFAVTGTKSGRKVEAREEAIAEHLDNASGFLVLISNDIKEPVEALKVYRMKDRAEKAFDDVKNDQDCRRLRVRSDRAAEGKLFIQFIALIISSQIRRRMDETGMLDGHTMQEVVSEMKLLRRADVEGRRRPFLTELTGLQKEVVRNFGLEL